MDKQLEKWQQSYQQSTPSVDAEVLFRKTQKANYYSRMKAYADLILGFLVSAFCVYGFFILADTILLKVLLVVLTPIPAGFGVWFFLSRKKADKKLSLDIQSLLTTNKSQALLKIQYWRVSAIVIAIMWLSLLAVIFLQIKNTDVFENWFVILLVQTPILIATLVRFWIVKNKAKQEIENIEKLLKEY